jgi:WD repeat-containing protein 19
MKKLFQIGPQHHGNGGCTFAWQPGGLFVASVGEGQRILFLFDRRGQQVTEVQLRSTAKVLQLEWDKDGEVLAILQAGDDSVQLWRQADKKLETLELHSKDPSWLAWSKLGPQLVVGTGRGNVTIFNKSTMKKLAIVGKHSKKITCGGWHPLENVFACGSEDRTVTVNTEDGEPLAGQGDEALRLKNEPLSIKFPALSGMSDGRADRDRIVAIINGDTSLLVYKIRDENSKPTDLSFQPHYGNIVTFCWLGDSYLVIGFSDGWVVVVNASIRDGSVEEASSAKYHPNALYCLCCSKVAERIASAGDDGIRIISAKDFKEVGSERIQLRPEAKVVSMHWSDDGELLSFCTETGFIYCYLAKLTVLSATCNTRLAYLTSLQELTICDCADEAAGKVVLQADVEPGLIALGPNHVAAAFNNNCWYYSASSQGNNTLVNKMEYVGSVKGVSLNATHAATLIEGGRLFLHSIEKGDDKMVIFPRREGDGQITSAHIVAGFLIYAHTNGRVQYYSLADQTEVNEYKHSSGVRKFFPNQEGTRCIIVDVSGAAFLYNPVNDDCIIVPNFPAGGDRVRVLWDSLDSGVFIAVDSSRVFTFMYSHVEVGGSAVRCLGSVDIGPEGELMIEKLHTEIGQGQNLLLLLDGVAWCQQANGALLQQRLRSHELLGGVLHAGEPTERLKTSFKQALSLNRFQQAFKLGLSLGQKDLWIAMGRRCLECLDMAWAKKAYRQAPSPGMVLYLERIQTVEDKQLLSGHVDSLLGRYEKAREHFLQSICPEAALDMHCDFLQWDKAISLAQSLAPQRLPAIYLKSALALEAKAEYQQALNHFEAASGGQDSPDAAPDHSSQCRAGIARTSVRLGDLSQGMDVAKSLGDPAVCKDCAASLERMRQFSEAAEMYVQAGAFDQAANLYIQEFNFDAAAPLMSKIHTPMIHMKFAKAKETRGAFNEALEAYERARDLDSVVRLSLEKLDKPARAFQLVRETGLASGAERVADYCMRQGNIPGAIEFFLLARMDERAFELAERHDAMSNYEEHLGEQGDKEQHLVIAKYYEQRSRNSEAAKHYSLCGEYHTALKLYLKVGEKEIDNAIEVVGKARNDALMHQLVSYLMGDSDNVPKAPVYICKLHKVLGNHLQAANAALMIARQEQDDGNYKAAHQLLLNSYQDLRREKLPLPQELWRRIVILHSYVIVKRLVKAGDHPGAARMLLRVAKHIQQFQSHTVPILTSVVIECQRAKMTSDAYKYACELMKPENRPQITEQYKKKIENIVRKGKPEEQDELQEVMSNCMHCGFSLPDSQLDCPNCMNISPFCIITGMRMLKEDWSRCTSCHFPARRSAFLAALQNGDSCPMCDAVIKPAELTPIPDSAPHIAEYKSLFKPDNA